MCLSSQGSLRSCLPPLLGWTLGRVLIQTTCSAFSCHSTSCDQQLLHLLLELWFWGTPRYLGSLLRSFTWKFISRFPDKISFIVPARALRLDTLLHFYLCVCVWGECYLHSGAQAMHHWHFISAWLPCFRSDPFPLAASRYYLRRFMRRCPVPGDTEADASGAEAQQGGPINNPQPGLRSQSGPWRLGFLPLLSDRMLAGSVRYLSPTHRGGVTDLAGTRAPAVELRRAAACDGWEEADAIWAQAICKSSE